MRQAKRFDPDGALRPPLRPGARGDRGRRGPRALEARPGRARLDYPEPDRRPRELRARIPWFSRRGSWVDSPADGTTPDLPPVKISESALEQIFFTLIQNAIDAADGKKWHKLIISAKKENIEIRLQFSDDCCGLTKKNLRRIFEAGFTTKSIEKGNGFGLSLVEHILECYDGQIQVKSTVGKGTTFKHQHLPNSSKKVKT